MPGRQLNPENYRFGFNGQERDNEIAGVGNINTAEFWEYDTRIARRWNLDPIVQESSSNYATFFNNPTLNSDINGDCPNGDCETSKNPNGQRVSIPSGSEKNGTESSGLMNFKPSNENFSYFWNIKQQAYVSVEGKIYSEGTWVDGFNSINSSDYSRVTSNWNSYIDNPTNLLSDVNNMIDVTLKAPLKALNFNTYKSIYQENADYLALSNFQKGRADAGGLKCLFDNYLTFAPLGYTTLAIGRYMIETKNFTLNSGYGDGLSFGGFKVEWGYSHTTSGRGTLFSIKQTSYGGFALRWDYDAVPHGSSNIRWNSQLRLNESMPFLNKASIQRHPLFFYPLRKK